MSREGTSSDLFWLLSSELPDGPNGELKPGGQQWRWSDFFKTAYIYWVSQVAQWLRISLPGQETQEIWVRSLGQKDPLEEEMAAHSSILAGIVSWAEEPGGLWSRGSQRVRYY